jgi:hypothetical protein
MVGKLFKPVDCEDKGLTINILSIAFAIAAGLFVLRASYPGYLNPDSVNQLIQIITGNFNDWQSPFSTWVWAGLTKLIPGPFGFAVFVNVLVWGSFALLARLLSWRYGYWSLLVFLVPFMPGAFNLLGNVHKDVLLVGWLLAASVMGYLVYQDDLPKRKRTVFRLIANLLLIAAFLTRLNAIFAILPLLLYINHGLGWRRNILFGIVLVLIVPMLHASLQKLTQADRLYPGNSIKTFHLLGLSYIEGRNLFPGDWTDEQSRKIVEACHTPVQWDTAAFWGKCGFIHNELRRQKVWDSGRLTYAWINGILNNPQGLFTIMSATFHKSLYDPNSRSMFYNPEKSTLFDWEVKLDPPRITTRLTHDFVGSKFNDRLGRPFVFAIITFITLALLTCARCGLNKDDLFAITILSSGLVNLISYFLVSVSAEYRYFYWSGFTAYLGLVITIMSIVIRNGRGLIVPHRAWLKSAVFVLLGITIGLIAVSKPLPSVYRQLRLTSLDESSIKIKTLRRASIPNWMGIRIHGDLALHGWRRDEKGLLDGNKSSGTLIATVPTQGKAIEIEIEASSSRGRVLVESDGFTETVKLDPSIEKSKFLYVWPTSSYDIRQHYNLWSSPLLATLFALISIGLLYWIDSRYKKSR